MNLLDNLLNLLDVYDAKARAKAHKPNPRDGFVIGRITKYETGDDAMPFASWENPGWNGREQCLCCEAAIIGYDMDFLRLHHLTRGPRNICAKCVAAIAGMVQCQPDRTKTVTSTMESS